jgi:hypothetical protein
MNKIVKGKYEVSMNRNDSGSVFVLMTYEARPVPGFPGKYYANGITARRAADRMLAQV